MSILYINYPPLSTLGYTPQLIYVGTSDTLATVITPGYLNAAIPTYGNIFSENQMAMVYTTDELTVLLSISISGSTITLVEIPSTGAITSISGTANQITASPSTGAVTLSIPTTFIAPGSIAATTTISGTTLNSSTLTASTALASDAGKNIVSSSTTATELGYVHGVTSNIQAQINAITGSLVSSITGTANEITASASTGAVTLSIPSAFIAPGTITSTGLLTSLAGITVTGGDINLATDSAAHDINIGNTTGDTAINVRIGAGTYSLDGVGGSAYVMGASTTTGAISIGGTAQTGTITLGDSSGTNIVNIATGSGATTVNIGTGGTGAVTDNIYIGSTTGDSYIELRAGSLGVQITGFLNITSLSDSSVIFTDSTGNIVTPVAVDNATVITSNTGIPSLSTTLPSLVQGNTTVMGANSSAAITIGNTGGDTAINVRVGAGTFSLDGVSGSAYVIGASTTTGVTTIGGTAQTGTITLGSSSGTNIVAIGAGAGATTVNIAGGATNAKTINIGTGAVANAINLNYSSGTTTLNGANVVTGTLTLNADPVSALQAATKQYVDAVAAGIDLKDACYAASTPAGGDLNATYNNGVSGVGATLTSNLSGGSSVVFTLDGTTPPVTSRILVKNQTNTYTQGIYTVTTAGVAGVTPWVLTRATDYNTPAQIAPGNLIPVINGTVNADTSWLETATVTAIGSGNPITFVQFTFANPIVAVTATSPLLSSGGTSPNISLNAPVSGTYGGTGVNNGSSTITIGGNVTFSGAYTFTGTLSANTSVTFPTSGLLSTTTGTVTSVGISSSTGLQVASSPVTSSGTITVDVPLSISGKNLLFNSGMQIFQRGTSISVSSSTTVYTADRWQLTVAANQATTVSQVAGALSGSYFIRIQRNSGQTGTGNIYFAQSLTRDMSNGAAGNKISFSFIARGGANFSGSGGNITVTVYSGTGSTDVSGIDNVFTGSASPISATQGISTTATLYTFTSASAVSSSATQLCAQISWAPTGTAGSNDYLDLTDFKLEISATPTAYQPISTAEEILNCQYFYQLISGFSGSCSSGTVIQLSPSWRPMRATPTISTTGNIAITDGQTNYTASGTSITSYVATNSGGLLTMADFSGLTTYRPIVYNGNVNGNVLTLSAELT